jgi:hypothetical protein
MTGSTLPTVLALLALAVGLVAVVVGLWRARKHPYRGNGEFVGRGTAGGGDMGPPTQP